MLGNVKQTETLKRVEKVCKQKKIKLDYYQCTRTRNIVVKAKALTSEVKLFINREGLLTK